METPEERASRDVQNDVARHGERLREFAEQVARTENRLAGTLPAGRGRAPSGCGRQGTLRRGGGEAGRQQDEIDRETRR